MAEKIINVNVRLTEAECEILDERCRTVTKKTGERMPRGTFFRALFANSNPRHDLRALKTLQSGQESEENGQQEPT